MVKSADLGLWWKDMTTFMVPIGSIITPKSIKAGKSLPVEMHGWADIVEAPTMNLSLVSLNQSQGGMCISGVLKTTERTPRHLIPPLGPTRVATDSAV